MRVTPLKFVLKVPADKHGQRLVEDLKHTLNSDTYKVRVRYSGKKRSAWGDTKKKDASYMRIYLTERQPTTESEQVIARINNRNNEYTSTLSEMKGLVDRALGIRYADTNE